MIDIVGTQAESCEFYRKREPKHCFILQELVCERKKCTFYKLNYKKLNMIEREKRTDEKKKNEFKGEM